MMSSNRGWRAVAVVTLLALVIAGFGVAALGPSQEVVAALNTDWSCRTKDPETGVNTYEPGCKGTRDVGQGEVAIGINQAGFRGEPPQHGARKLLLLGGSTLFAPGLGNKQEPGGLLEQSLAEQGHDFDVLNLSVEGYTTTQHAIRFKAYLDKYRPKVVVVDTLSRHKMFLDLVLQPALIRNDEGLPRRLRSPSSAWGPTVNRWMPQGLKAWARTWVTSSWSLAAARQVEDLDEAGVARVLAEWQHALLDGALALARKRGVTVVMVWDGSPVANQRILRVREAAGPARALSELTPQLAVSSEVMTAALRAQRIPLLTPGRLPQDSETDLFLGDSPYYGPKGIKRWTGSVARAMAKRELL